MKPAGLKLFGWTFAIVCYGRPFGRRRKHEVYVDRIVKRGWRSRDRRASIKEQLA